MSIEVLVGNCYVTMVCGGNILYKIRDIRPYAWNLIKRHIESESNYTIIDGDKSLDSSIEIRCFKEFITFDFYHTILSVPMGDIIIMMPSVLKYYAR
jgi:hypothetical protein